MSRSVAGERLSMSKNSTPKTKAATIKANAGKPSAARSKPATKASAPRAVKAIAANAVSSTKVSGSSKAPVVDTSLAAKPVIAPKASVVAPKAKAQDAKMPAPKPVAKIEVGKTSAAVVGVKAAAAASPVAIKASPALPPAADPKKIVSQRHGFKIRREYRG